MDVDPLEHVEEDEEESKGGDGAKGGSLNRMVAVTVALLATFMGICKVKDDNIVQAMQQAQADKTYDRLNLHDDQFDLADAALSIAISLLAVTALTQKRWLYYLALVPTVFGLLMGLAGLLGWGLHPDALARLLS